MIYFMQPTDGGPVKIGCTDDVEARHRQLEKHYGKTLVILATIEGDFEQERELHRRFARLRFGRTEQFRPDRELLEFIGRPLFASMADVKPLDPAAHDPTRDDVSIKFDRTLARKARLISEGRGVSMAEYLSEMTRPIIDRDYAKLMRELEGGKGQ